MRPLPPSLHLSDYAARVSGWFAFLRCSTERRMHQDARPAEALASCRISESMRRLSVLAEAADVIPFLRRHLAAREGAWAVTEWLLESGASINAVDRFQRTPLEVPAPSPHALPKHSCGDGIAIGIPGPAGGSAGQQGGDRAAAGEGRGPHLRGQQGAPSPLPSPPGSPAGARSKTTASRSQAASHPCREGRPGPD